MYFDQVMDYNLLMETRFYKDKETECAENFKIVKERMINENLKRIRKK